MEANQMQPRTRDECGQALHELQRRHHDMGGPVAVDTGKRSAAPSRRVQVFSGAAIHLPESKGSFAQDIADDGVAEDTLSIA